MRLAEAVAFALTGERVPDRPSADEASSVVAWLADQGYTPERLAAERERCQAAQVAWPHVVPESVDAGFAQFHAVLTEVREATGTSGLTRHVRHGTPGPGDERFLRERPPHHGSV